MTSKPPPKITSVPAGTPSGEWANKTESMLQSDVITTDPAMKSTPKSAEPPIMTTTNLTPGNEFPGSYPRELEGQEQQVPQGNGSEGPPMASVVQTAKQYMPDNVERTVEYAGQRAAAYLPIPQGIKNTVTSYWSSDQRQGSQPEGSEQLSTSLPSSETKGAQPFEHVGGVGSLPGTLSESSVALLPDERAAKTPVSKDESQTQGDNQAKSAAFPTGAAAAVKTESFVPSKSPLSQVQSSQDGAQTVAQQAEKASTTETDEPLAKLSEPESDPQQPYKAPDEQHSRVAETAAIGGAAVGVGSVAGQPGLTDRATSGDRVPSHESQARDQPRTEVAGSATGTSELPKDDVEHKQVKLMSQGTQQKKQEETKSNPRETTEEEGVKHTHKTGAGAGGYNTGYHAAKVYPAPTGEIADQAEAQPDSSVSPKSATTASVTDSPKERRVSFLHKVRGEAKIIAGKVSGKEDKVEEGKRIIHGEV